jgi:hypothetical protein
MDVLARPELILLIVSARLLLPRVTSVAALALMLRNTDPADRPALLDAAGRCLASLNRAAPQQLPGAREGHSRRAAGTPEHLDSSGQ